MRRAFLLLVALALFPGCSYILPASNQPPKAYLNSIAPSEAAEGDVVRFVGYGTDVDGQVVAYRWRSDKDGQIGTRAEFETSSLSVGDHMIYFMVQDNNDAWSAEAQSAVKVLPEVSAPAKVNSFTASPASIPAGDSATLSWNVSNATAVVIDQGIGTVPAIGSVSVTPGVTTVYKLTATGGGSTATSQVTVMVQTPTLDIVFFNADPEAVPSGSVSTLTWKTTGATEVRIMPYIGTVAAEGDIDVPLDGEQVHVFTLTASKGTTTLTAEVEIESYLLMPDEHTVTLTADIGASGYVRSTGAPWAEYIYVGDDNNNISLQGFVTFDISGIPADAMIASVEVDLSDSASTYGNPFDDLGCLRAYADDYGTLGGSDYFDGSPLAAIGRWCSQDDVDTPGGGLTTDFKDALQDRVGQDTFQFRLQFNQEETDDDNNNDMVRWSGTDLPRLVVTYYSYD
jgi:hypothetical protein